MSEDIGRVGAQQFGAVRRDTRAMTERALHMRALAYLAKAKAQLLTQTIFEIDRSRRQQRSRAESLDGENEALRGQRSELEERASEHSERLRDADQQLRDADQQLRVRHQELEQAREARRLLATAIEQTAEGVVITDARGTIEYVNPSYVALSGYREDELLGRNPNLLKSGVMEPEFYREMWETLAAGEVWAGRFINRTKTGALWHGDTTLSPVRDDRGETAHYVGVVRDVSREVRLEEELRRAQKLDAIGQLAGGVAHDFNNVLTAILASVDLARAFLGALPEDVPGVGVELDTIAHSAKRAARLTRQLLVFSRRESSMPETVDLALATRGVERMLRRLLREDITLKVTGDAGLLVRIDPGHLEQVVVNLVINARDALPEGGSIQVAVEPAQLGDAYVGEHIDVAPGAYACLSVTDDGVGMDAETVEHVFEPFFTTKPEGEGTGLGLSTVHGIVTQAGGHVRVYSEVGEGTTLRLYLPLVPSGVVSEAAPSSAPPPRAPRAATLLVCDDDELVRTKLVAALVEAGYRVFGAGSVTEAKACVAREGAIDLLLTDVIMPDGSGPALAEELLRVRPALPVLMMSGHPGQALERHGLEPAPATFLQKPFRTATLLTRVAELLEG